MSNNLQDLADKAASQALQRYEDEMSRKRKNLKAQRQILEKERSKYTDKINALGHEVSRLGERLAEKNEKIKQQNKAITSLLEYKAKSQRVIRTHLGPDALSKFDYWMKRA